MKRFLILAVSMLAMGPLGALAIDGELKVLAHVEPSCTVSTTDLDFGTIEGPGPLSNAGEIEITCNRGVRYHISLNQGENPLGDSRRMTGPGGDTIPYALERPSEEPWGEGDLELISESDGTPTPWAVTGKLVIDAPLPSPGDYSDTVGITVELKLDEDA